MEAGTWRGEGHLARLADDLLCEILNFARVLALGPTSAKLEAYLPRFQSVSFVLRALGELGLRPGRRIPFIYNGQQWSSPVPAGYTGPGGEGEAPRPDEMLLSALSMMSTGIGGDSVPRILKAATFVAWRNGMPAALQYLLDLLDWGYAGGDEAGAVCLLDLLAGITQVRERPGLDEAAATRAWALERIPALESLQSGGDWTEARFIATPNAAEAAARSLYRGDVIQRLAALTEEARNAPDLTAFLVSQLRMNRILVAYLRAEHEAAGHTDAGPPVTLRSFIGQLHEVTADTNAFILPMLAGYGSPSGNAVFGTSRLFLKTAGDSPSARRRMERERILVPRALAPMPPDGYPRLPDVWNTISYQLAFPMTAAASATLDNIPLKDSTFSLRGVPDSERAESFRESFRKLFEADEAGMQQEVRALAAAGVAAFPWSAHHHNELAIALDKSGRAEEALPSSHAAVFLGPDQQTFWHSYSIILAHCGARQDALAARAMMEILIAPDQRDPSPGPGPG